MNIGERVRATRLQRHMTIAALASASDLSKGFISQVESGQSNPSLSSLRRIASSLGVPLFTLLGTGTTQLTSSNAPSLPRLFRPNLAPGIGPSITVLSEGADGISALVTLPWGASLRGESPANAGAMALCVVVKGFVRLEQNDSSLELSTGDTATWDLSSPYSIENNKESIAALFMHLPAGVDLPTFQYERPYVPATRIAALQGPLQLVAMRAERARRR